MTHNLFDLFKCKINSNLQNSLTVELLAASSIQILFAIFEAIVQESENNEIKNFWIVKKVVLMAILTHLNKLMFEC